MLGRPLRCPSALRLPGESAVGSACATKQPDGLIRIPRQPLDRLWSLVAPGRSWRRSATTARKTETLANTTGSSALTPNSSAFRTRETPAVSAIPSAIPRTTGRMDWPRTSRSTSGLFAPKRHANAQFPRSLNHAIAHLAVNSDRRQQQSQQSDGGGEIAPMRENTNSG